jgi:hypothetical protein
MSEPQQEGEGKGWGWLVPMVVALPLLYVLMLGPLVKLDQEHLLPEWFGPVIRLAYTPLIWLVETFNPVEKVLDWYLSLWGVK